MKRLMVLLLFVATAAQGEIYTWKDSRGTSHYTNLPDSIPVRYRSRVKVLPMPGDQKKEQSLLPPAQPPQAAAPAVAAPPAVTPARGGRARERAASAERRRRAPAGEVEE